MALIWYRKCFGFGFDFWVLSHTGMESPQLLSTNGWRHLLSMLAHLLSSCSNCEEWGARARQRQLLLWWFGSGFWLFLFGSLLNLFPLLRRSKGENLPPLQPWHSMALQELRVSKMRNLNQLAVWPANHFQLDGTGFTLWCRGLKTSAGTLFKFCCRASGKREQPSPINWRWKPFLYFFCGAHENRYKRFLQNFDFWLRYLNGF